MILGLVVLLAVAAAMPATAPAVVRIKDDHGGNISEYWFRFTALRDSGDQVMIDGICSSACTLVLGLMPPERICVTCVAEKPLRLEDRNVSAGKLGARLAGWRFRLVKFTTVDCWL